MEFLQLDVFADRAYSGNPLAVFPDGADLSSEQMQAIAREMNLSETTFVTSVEGDTYSVRIFTPAEELPFAGHPTLGTTWVLRHLGRVMGDDVIQRSAAGETPVSIRGDEVRLRRTGVVTDRQPDLDVIAEMLDLEASALSCTFLGKELTPGKTDAGIEMLMVPVSSLDVLGSISPVTSKVKASGYMGAYCFTPTSETTIRARGFWPMVGVDEDPATGVACACLGLYLADRVGGFKGEVMQGVEMGRPSRLLLSCDADGVEIGGECRLVLKGTLEALP